MTERFTVRGGRGRSGPVRIAFAVVLVALAAGCSAREPAGFVQRSGLIVSAPFGAPPGVGVTRYQLPGGGVAAGWPWFFRFAPEWSSTKDKIESSLRQRIAATPGHPPVEVLVEYSDPVDVPRFPVEAGSGVLGGPLDSLAFLRGKLLQDSLTSVRAAWYALERARLAANFNAVLLDSFWLTRSVVARIPMNLVQALAQRADVEWIQFAHEGAPAPAPVDCAHLDPNLENRNALVGDARKRINSDALRDAGYANGRISLLDTGVYTDHVLLRGLVGATEPDGPALVALDCTSGSNCTGNNTGDTDTGIGGHGTTDCGILVGDASLGDCLEGVTRARVECHRVYIPVVNAAGGSIKGEVDPAAYKHACEKLLVDRNPIAVLEVAEKQGPQGSYSRMAGRLFTAGVAVIAAAGNGYSTGPQNWIGSPGDHPWVISVGACLLKPGGGTDVGQSRGVVGFRQKPDLQTPTQTSSAAIGPPDDQLNNLGATSGATPYAGGAALILRNWLRISGTALGVDDEFDTGQVYAALIASCDGVRESVQPGASPKFPLDKGAGIVRLPSSGRGWWGMVKVGSSATLPVSFTVTDAGLRHLRAAIWWPDPQPARLFGNGLVVPHADYDLDLVDPNGAVRASSAGSDGVFERVDQTFDTDIAGTWRLRVSGHWAGKDPRRVYVAVIAEP